jgi:hypothetical protein
MRRLFLLLALVCSVKTFAQESSALINKALDETVKLDINKPLPEALRVITQQTDVRITADPAIWDLLPWGKDTVVQLKAENVTLRKGLDMMAHHLGLVAQVRSEFVEFSPCPPLARLGQRASKDELKALDVLSSQKPVNLGTNEPTIRQLLEAIDLQLADDKNVPLAIENHLADVISQDKKISVPRNATLMDALECIASQTRGTWYPWGNTIIICAKDDRARQLLRRPISIRGGAGGIDITQLILEIASHSGVPIEIEPGALSAVPQNARLLRGADGRPPVLENVPAQQILEIISGQTGLSFDVVDDHVRAALSPTASGQKAFGLLQLENGVFVLLSPGEIPADIRQYIQEQTPREFERIRAKMKTDKSPTTRP